MRIVFFLIAFLSGSCKEKKQVQTNEYTIVKYMNFNTTTIFSVPCYSLERMATDSITINTKSELDSIKKAFKEFKKINLSDIDTRGKILIYFNDFTEEYCFDKFGHFYKKDNYFINPYLFNFIKRKIKQ